MLNLRWKLPIERVFCRSYNHNFGELYKNINCKLTCLCCPLKVIYPLNQVCEFMNGTALRARAMATRHAVTSSRVTHVRYACRAFYVWHLQWMAARFLKLSSESVASLLELIRRGTQRELAFSKSGMRSIPTLNKEVTTQPTRSRKDNVKICLEYMQLLKHAIRKI